MVSQTMAAAAVTTETWYTEYQPYSVSGNKSAWETIAVEEFDSIKETTGHVNPLIRNSIDITDETRFKGKFAIDLDGEITKTIQAAIGLIMFFDNRNIPYQIFASGGKGFHFIVSDSYLEAKVFYNEPYNGHTKLYVAYKILAMKIADAVGIEVDSTLYAKRHLLRTEDKQRPDGNYKVHVSKEAVLNMTENSYFEWVSQPRPKIPALNEELAYGNLFDWFSEALIEANNTAEKQTFKIIADDCFEGWAEDEHPDCISAIAEGDFKHKDASFNGLKMSMGRYLHTRRDSISEDGIERLKKGLCNFDSKKVTSFNERMTAVDDTLSTLGRRTDPKDWQFGCQFMLTKSPGYSCGLDSSVCVGCKLKTQEHVLENVELDSNSVNDSNYITPLSQAIADFSKNAPDVYTKGKIWIARNTFENLRYLVECYRIKIVYDIILKKQFIQFPDELGEKSDISDEAGYQRIRSLCAKNGLDKSASDYLPMLFDQNVQNPLLDWVKSVSWDGVDRIQPLVDCLVIDEHVEHVSKYKLYVLSVTTTWLIQCVAAWDAASSRLDGIPKFELCLTLVGPQGAMKTSLLKSLLPREVGQYFLEGITLDPNDKDSIKKATSAGLVELGELDGTFRKADIARIKSHFSSTRDVLRLPYARVQSNFQRRTSYCASVNHVEFLMDDTGNRRFIPILVSECKAHDLDMQQVWGQIWSLYLEGKNWWLTKEQDAMVKTFQQQHQSVSALEEKLTGYFCLDTLNVSVGKISFSTVEALQAIGILNPKRHDVAQANMVFKKFGFRLFKSGARRTYLLPNNPPDNFKKLGMTSSQLVIPPL
jgi:putative DNA primase/helicase